ncbi:MAG: phosphoribosyltransferase [Sphingomonas sp.]|nr:phosphoribosyltransferase [Sphingomonas sp.]
MSDLLFRDRVDAGRRLAAVLAPFEGAHPLVLALPRGGVPVAFEIARELQADLDLLFVRKLGAPGHEEFGIGAVVDGAHPQVVLNEMIVRALRLEQRYIDAELARQLREIERRRSAYMGNRASQPIGGRTVIVVDDGIATGSTMLAALQGIRRNHPAQLVLAVPLAPTEALRELRPWCDEIVCLAAPEPFHAVGLHYADFAQTSDAEVVRLLAQARNWRHAADTSKRRKAQR